MPQRAVFLDRDNTLMEDPGFVSAPEQVRLLPGAADAVRTLRRAGYRVVVVSNQSGVARGMFDENTLARIHDRLKELMAGEGAPLDAIYYCPYLPGEEAAVDAYRTDSELRKPRPGMLLKAAREMDIDLSVSWMIGDGERDVAAGKAAGCRTVLISGAARSAEEEPTVADFVAADLCQAARTVLERTPQQENGSVSTAGTEDTNLLREILHTLRSQKRMEGQAHFSLGWLACVIVQVGALAVGFRAMLLLVDQSFGPCFAWFLFACFLQLWALTLAVISRSS